MDFLFEQLISHASIEPDIDVDNTPTIALYSDPFQEISGHSNHQTEILIRKTNLLAKSNSSSHISSHAYVRRVYIKSILLLDYRYIGWVLDCDMVICMICSNEFSLFNRRHHCRICGDLVCDNCSKQTIYITEIMDYGPVRACDCCYYGQEEISLKALVYSFENSSPPDIPDNESIFSMSDPTLSTLIGTPYVVMKCKKLHSRGSDGAKVFINICYHTLILAKNTILIGEDCPKEVVGKNGESCSVYDVCVSLDTLEQDDTHLEQFFSRVVAVLNRRCRANLDQNYILLRTKKNFKGDHIPYFLIRLPNGQVLKEHSTLNFSPLGFYDEAAQKSPLPASPTSSYLPHNSTDRSNSRTRTISSDDRSEDVGRNETAATVHTNCVESEVSEQHKSDVIDSSVEPTSKLQDPPNDADEVEPVISERKSESKSDRRLVGAVPLVGLASSSDQSLIFSSQGQAANEESDIQSSVPPEENTEIVSIPAPPPSSPLLSPKIPCPEMYSGWMKRQEGTLISTFVKRYFVLEKCVLTCYEMSADTPPYGRNPRGVFQLTHATQIDLISTPSASPAPSSKRNSLFTKQQKKKSLTQTQLLLSDPMRKETMDSSNIVSDPEEYLLELETIENHARWVQALLHHIEYCTITKRRFSLP